MLDLGVELGDFGLEFLQLGLFAEDELLVLADNLLETMDSSHHFVATKGKPATVGIE